MSETERIENGLAPRWTDERVEKLKELHGKGIPTRQIAARLGGISKNGVISKLHRLGITGNTDNRGRSTLSKIDRHRRAKGAALAVKREKAVEEGMPVEPTPIVRIHTFIPEPPSKQLTVLQLTDSVCKWASDERPYTFCGHPSRDNLPWCDHHAARAFNTPAPRVRLQRAYR